jgi:hypothetical protein
MLYSELSILSISITDKVPRNNNASNGDNEEVIPNISYTISAFSLKEQKKAQN